MKFPFQPIQAGYSGAFVDGNLSVALDGGAPRSRLDILGAPTAVEATWVLYGDQYTLFMGYIRNWFRAGGAAVQMNLILDAATADTYDVMFTPGTVRLVSKAGQVFTVSASLLVLPLDKYLDGAVDVSGSLAALIGAYGSLELVMAMLAELALLANEDMPHA